MIITYLRSSSYTCHEMCPMKYYLEYILGWKSPPNKKAEKGTIVHKVMELLAVAKKTIQEGNRKTFDDEIAGRVHTENYNLDKLIDKCYYYYSTNSVNKWTSEDLRDCRKWVYKTLEYNKGEFHPFNSEIVQPEQSFDITIAKPWAMYDYTLPDNKRIEGFLAIKGTIDQVSKIDDNTYMILDWKTGRRWDWAKDHEKTAAKLQNDPQLMLYYYAAQHLYPEVDDILITIYFINDGGPYSVFFSKEDLPRIERMLQQKFEDIKHTEIPRRNKSWKCKKFCYYGMNTFKGTNIQPIKEKRLNQVCNIGEDMTICEQTAYCLSHRPESSVIQHMSKPGHKVDYYQKPGDVSDAK